MYSIISLCILLTLILFLSPPTLSTTRICSKQGECEGRNIICSSREACYVWCLANWACRGTTIECPTGQECHIICHYDGELLNATSGQLICQDMIIQATDSTLLTINASIGNQPTLTYPRTLEGAMIYCPHNSYIYNDKACRIYCDGDDLMRATTIMAVHGMNDLFIKSIHYSKPWCIRGTELKCGVDYSISCSLTNTAPFECNDSDQLCPTASPTNQPTARPIFNMETATPTTIHTATPITTDVTKHDTISLPVTSSINTTATISADRESAKQKSDDIDVTIWIIIILIVIIIIITLLYVRTIKQQRNSKRLSSMRLKQDISDENIMNESKGIQIEGIQNEGIGNEGVALNVTLY